MPTQHRLCFGVNDIGEPLRVLSQQGLDLNHTGNHEGAGRPVGGASGHLGERRWAVWGCGAEEGGECFGWVLVGSANGNAVWSVDAAALETKQASDPDHRQHALAVY